MAEQGTLGMGLTMIILSSTARHWGHSSGCVTWWCMVSGAGAGHGPPRPRILLASAGQGPPGPRDLLASAGQGPPRPRDLLLELVLTSGDLQLPPAPEVPS